MNILELIELVIKSDSIEYDLNYFNDYCVKHQISLDEFFNRISKQVAIEFIEGRFDYDYADDFANCIFAHMTHQCLSENTSLPEPAWSIYLAFDRGEYRNSKIDHEYEIPSEKYTRPMLREILGI